MRVFLDINVVVDFLTMREPFFKSSALIMELARLGKIEVIISSLTFINIAYIVRKAFGKKAVIEKLEKLATLCQISEINNEIIKGAIAMHSKDFEDCVQCLSAKSASADLIVTRDKDGFTDLPVIFMSPEAFWEACQKNSS